MKSLTKILFIFLVVAIIPQKNYSSTEIGGVISVNRTLTLDESPYIVTNNLLVKAGVSVDVEPGVVLKFNKKIYLQVDGEFQAVGTQDAKILFTCDELWGSIIFTESATAYDSVTNKGALLSYCIIENTAGTNDFARGEIRVFNKFIKVDNCEFRNAEGISLEHSNGIIMNSYFHSSRGVYIGGYPSFGLSIINNNIFENIYGDDVICLCNNTNCEGNTFKDISQTLLIVRVHCKIANIINNRFENCNSPAIGLLGGDKHNVQYNTFINNSINFLLTCTRKITVENNNFMSFTDNNLYWARTYGGISNTDCKLPSGSGTYDSIDVTNNYWNNLSMSDIIKSIFDFRTDFNCKGLFVIEPILSSMAVYDGTTEVYGIVPNTANDILISPNPANEKLTIQLPKNQYHVFYITLFNSQGTELKTFVVNKNLVNGLVKFDISSYNSGLYFITFQYGEKFISQKFIINR